MTRDIPYYFLPARTQRVQAGTESRIYVSIFVCMSAVISSSSSSTVSLEEGSSRTCVGAVLRDLSLYDIMSGIRRRRRRRRRRRKRRRGERRAGSIPPYAAFLP